ncbi:tRNA uridine-5-carboxymethylaminomethyl(34) synthesis GTPase MnmE [Microbaculum marinum]|uniref:tRNA modification GTPase MnmE n=1 Tax=Microbaculum marinum TaxID=1764581 RepID=A0AAW9S1D4_9HYPH
MNSGTDTIFALSSGSGKAGVAVVRISGPDAGAALRDLTGGIPKERHAVLRSIRDRNGEKIDRGLILWLPGPGSFTGEDMAEFQVHGGRSVVSGLIETLAGMEGLRPAEPGEFARRAFGNGKLDLTEIEGLADLIDAETVLQRRQALRQLEGRSGEIVEDWRRRLIGAIALCEAGIDFVDEDDVSDEVGADITPIVAHLRAEICGHLEEEPRGESIRTGLTVVIAGPPNAGKSSLLNALARRDVAIVADVPGTTRDAIEVRLELGGVPVTMVDTAGIRASGDEIEMEGVRRAERHVADADLVLWLADSSAETSGLETRPRTGPETWWVSTKIDLVDGVAGRIDAVRFGLSALSGAGVGELLRGLAEWATNRVGSGTIPVITRVRHRRELESAAAALERAGGLDYRSDPDLVAEELRAAANALGRVTGRIDVEDVLDAIFRDFCIGK